MNVCKILLFLTSEAYFLPARKAAVLFLVFIWSLVIIRQSLCCFPYWLWWGGKTHQKAQWSQNNRYLFKNKLPLISAMFTWAAASTLLFSLLSLRSIRVYSSRILGDAHSGHLLSYWAGRAGTDTTTTNTKDFRQQINYILIQKLNSNNSCCHPEWLIKRHLWENGVNTKQTKFKKVCPFTFLPFWICFILVFGCIHFVWWLTTTLLDLFQHAPCKLLWEMPLKSYRYQLDKTQAATDRQGMQEAGQRVHTGHSKTVHDYIMQKDHMQIHPDNSWISSPWKQMFGFLCRQCLINKPITGTTYLITWFIIMLVICIFQDTS